MPIRLKTPQQIESMRRAGALAAQILAEVAAAVEPGMTTADLDGAVAVRLARAGATSTAKGYPTYTPGRGFPGYCCTSVNEEVLHAPPGSRVLRSGDVLTLDLTLRLGGYCASRAITVPVGLVDAEQQRLLRVTEETLALAVSQIVPGRAWSEVARQIQQHVESNGYNVVREFVGHGIGTVPLEDPKVPNFVGPAPFRGDFILRPGMTFTVEPMILSGRRDVALLEDGWTVVAEDGMPSAHVRHTVAVTTSGADVLTR